MNGNQVNQIVADAYNHIWIDTNQKLIEFNQMCIRDRIRFAEHKKFRDIQNNERTEQDAVRFVLIPMWLYSWRSPFFLLFISYGKEMCIRDREGSSYDKKSLVVMKEPEETFVEFAMNKEYIRLKSDALHKRLTSG